MENNSAVIECLILFYIDMKNVLKTKQLIERAFVNEMVKHCKKNGFVSYSDDEIKKTWTNLVLKYMNLKNKGTVEERENWKYYEILDSCYEHADFYTDMHSKFSEEMVWLLIECFLKRRALRKSQKLSTIVAEVHKEFLQYGYLYITKQDIENKWKYLNRKYQKLKGDSESLKKVPYLQALQAFHEGDTHYMTKMIFTRELTEILIERFTEKKIRCVIHGYDSDQVLNEIQSEFKDLGFYFSKEDISQKWKKLSTIYKFISAKGKNDTSWIYFKAMNNHFKDDFLLPWGHMEHAIIKKNNSSRRIRPRSKSVGVENNKREVIVMLEKTPSQIELRNGRIKKASVKRSSESGRRNKHPKKIKTKDRPKERSRIPHVTDACQGSNENLNSVQTDTTSFTQGSYLNILSTNRNQESTDQGSSTSKVHIININHSDIDRKNGNLTINLPSITKKFSDNEFLPLKKRLRVDDDKDRLSDTTNDAKNGFPLFSMVDDTESQKLLNVAEDKRLTEEETREIIRRMSSDNLYNFEANSKLNASNYKSEKFNKYHNIYNNFNQQRLLIPKEEHQDSLSMQDYTNPNSIPQPPVLLLVIKVDGNKPSNENANNDSLKVNVSSSSRISPCEHSRDSERKNDFSEKQQNEQPSTTAHASMDSATPVDKKITTPEKTKEIVTSLEVNTEKDTTNDNSDVVAPGAHTHICNFGTGFKVTESEQVDVDSSNSNNAGFKDIDIENHEISDMCSVAENVTVYTTEESEVQSTDSTKENISEKQKADEVVFREPLAVGEKINSFIKPKVISKTSHIQNNVSGTHQGVRQQLNNGKIRLPVKGGGKLKEIIISARELNKISKLKPGNFKTKIDILKKPSETDTSKSVTDANVPVQNTFPAFKYMSQTVKLSSESLTEKNGLGITNLPQSKNARSEDFETESVFSEVIGEEDGLKDNLLATVIDFQEQNNQEFIEIKNLMKQNNLLQRETNRLLRLILEKQ